MPGGFSAFMGSPAGGAAVQGGFSVGGNLFSAREAKKQNRRNLKLYRENRAWEEEMANTEWQRGVADMLAAGINPMMAVNQGGASTPNVAPAHVEKEEGMSKVMESVSKNPATLLAMQQMAANIELTQANAFKATQEGKTAEARAGVAPEMAQYEMNEVRQRVYKIMQDNDLSEAQQKQIEEMLPVAIKLEEARIALAKEQSTSAAQTRRLEALTEPELQATARWFESIVGGGGRITTAIKDIIQTIRMLRGK